MAETVEFIPCAGAEGTVTSVDANTTIDGLEFTGGPITGNGTLTLALDDAAAFRTAIGAGTGNGTGNGTVTSVDGCSTFLGVTLTGGPITTAGTLTLALDNAGDARTSLDVYSTDEVDTLIAGVPQGTVTSVDGSGGSTGLTLTGGPFSTSGTLTLGGTLLVTSGGTSKTSHTNNAILVGNGTGGFKELVGSAAKQVPTWSGSAWVAALPPTSASGTRFLATDYTLSGSNGSWSNVSDGSNVSVTLPSAGTYIVWQSVRAYLLVASGSGFLRARLYNETAGAEVSGSNWIICDQAAGTLAHLTASPAPAIVTVTGAATIRLQGLRDGAASYTYTILGAGGTGLTYLKVL